MSKKIKWKLMGFAKRTGGWDIWLGKKLGMSFDCDPFNRGEHWHSKNFVIYRHEY